MFLEGIVVGEILAPVVSAILVVILYHYIGSRYLGGAENAVWNGLRIVLLSSGDSWVRTKTKFALTNAANDAEYVGRVRADSTEFAITLDEDAGYKQCVAAGLKYRPSEVDPNTSSQVEFESGSMAFRESRSDLLPDALAFRQNHIYWFDNGDGTLDVYAHYEYSSLNPVVAWKHYRAVGQDAERGREMLEDHLGLDLFIALEE